MQLKKLFLKNYILKLFFRVLLIASSLLILSGCGGGGISETKTPVKQGETPTSSSLAQSSTTTTPITSSSDSTSEASLSSQINSLSSSSSPIQSSSATSAQESSPSSSTPPSSMFSSSSAPRINIIAREGDPAIGFAAGVNYEQIYNPSVGSNGDIVFLGRVNSSGTDTINAVWAGKRDQISLVAKSGDPIIGSADNLSFSYGTTPTVTTMGNFAMLAGVNELRSGGAINSTNALLAYHNHQLQNIVRAGEIIPATPEVGLIDSSEVREILSFAFSDSGAVIEVRTSGTIIGNFALLYWDYHSLKLIAVSGALISPYNHCLIASDSNFRNLLINDAGDIIFKINLTAIDDTSGKCPENSILRWSDNKFEVAVDTQFTIPAYPETIFTDLTPEAINNQGELAYRATSKIPVLVDPDNIFNSIPELASERQSAWLKGKNTSAKLIAKQGDSFHPNGYQANLAGEPILLLNDSSSATIASAAVLTSNGGIQAIIASGEARAEIPYTMFEEDGVDSQLNSRLHIGLNLPEIGMISNYSTYGLGFTNQGDIILKVEIFPIYSSIIHLDNHGEVRELIKTYQDLTIDGQTIQIRTFNFDEYTSGLRKGQPSQLSEVRTLVFSATTSSGLTQKKLILEEQF
jgi:hypothetical protein